MSNEVEETERLLQAPSLRRSPAASSSDTSTTTFDHANANAVRYGGTASASVGAATGIRRTSRRRPRMAASRWGAVENNEAAAAAAAAAEAASSPHNDDDDEAANRNAAGNPPPSSEPEPDNVVDVVDEEDEEETIAFLTRRLRCLFAIITWPIVPLGTLAALCLCWLLYTAFAVDHGRCAHPLHAYAWVSLGIVLYTPYHAKLRAWLCAYFWRDIEQPDRHQQRPVLVRRLDQIFHSLSLVYVYAGIMMVQTCRSDMVKKDQGDDSGDIMMSTCQATCPHLFGALTLYVGALELFTFSLLLPLLFLPCIYLWFLRRASADPEAMSMLQERLREEEAVLRHGSISAEEVLRQLEDVKLVVDTTTSPRTLVLPANSNNLMDGHDVNGNNECCICMEPFVQQVDIETGHNVATEDEATTATASEIVRTVPCGHIFHKSCMASWVGGRWESNSSRRDGDNTNSNGRHRRARRTTCPLCRRDLRP